MGFAQKKKARKPRNRQTKQVLVFDEDARKDYLTGFRKRKDARKAKGKEIAERKLREEKHRLKMQKKAFEEKVKHQTLPPDLEEIARQEVQELPEHTVTITDITEVDLAGQGGMRLGLNKFEDSSDEDEENRSDAEESHEPSEEKPKNKQQQQELLNQIGKKIKKTSKQLKSKSKKSSQSKRRNKRTLSKRAKHKIKRLGKRK